MKMKSDFLKKLKTWGVLALSALVMTNVTACKDDKDDPTPPNPEPVAATYSISGTVYSSDATTAMSGVTVDLSGAKSASTTTGNDGSYKFDLSTTSGNFTVKFSKEGYKTMSVPVVVSAIASGTIDYSVNAALVKEATPDPDPKPEPDPVYKTPVYSLSINITDMDGKAINAKDLVVSVKGGDIDITKNEASFELTNLKPGVYSISAKAEGYDIASGKVLVNQVTEKVEGEGTYTVKTGATFTMKTATLTPEEAAYNINGKITDAEGKAVASSITLSCSDESFTTRTMNASEFSVAKVDPKLVDAGATFYLTVKAEGYYSYSWNFKLNKVAAGQTWNEVINIVLSKIVVVPDPTPDPDPTPTPDPEEETTTEVTKPSTEVSTEDLKEQEAVKEVVTKTDETTGETVTEVQVEAGKTVDLGTIEAKETDNTSGETKEIVDQISFTAPAGTEAKIVMPQSEGENQTLSVKRESKTETTINKEQNLESLATSSSTSEVPVSKEDLAKPETEVAEVPVAAVERIFTGEPTGTKFVGAPLTIESPAPTGVAADDPTELPMALLTSENGIIWKLAPADMGKVICQNGKMIVEVNHFSMFAPGFEMGIAKINSSSMTTEKKDTKYSGKIFTKDSFKFTAEVEDGLVYTDSDGSSVNYPAYTTEEMGKQIFKTLSNATDTKEYLFKKLLDKIKSDNNKVYPNSGAFAKKSKEFIVPVERNTTIDYIKLTTTYIVKVYSIKVGGTTYKIGVKSVNNQTVSVVYKSEHGHGHGEDANAGGGIVDFE